MNEATYVYIVHSDINENNVYAEFATEEEAIDYARRHKDELTYVDRVEAALDADGDIIEIFDGQTIWIYTDEDEDSLSEGIKLRTREEQEEFFRLCDEIGLITDRDIRRFEREVGCTDENILQALRDYRAELGPDFKIANPELEREMAKHYEDFDADALVETLEENEDVVECKECFDLFPKADCIKIEIGYVCPECGKVHGYEKPDFEIDLISDVVIADEDTFKVDFPELERVEYGNDMIPDEPTPEPMPEVGPNPEPIAEPCVGSECEAPVEAPITKDETITKLVVDEHEAIDGYDKAKIEIEANSELEEKEKKEILDTIEHIKEEEIEHIEELEELVDKSGDEPEVLVEGLKAVLDDYFKKDGKRNPENKNGTGYWVDLIDPDTKESIIKPEDKKTVQKLKEADKLATLLSKAEDGWAVIRVEGAQGWNGILKVYEKGKCIKDISQKKLDALNKAWDKQEVSKKARKKYDKRLGKGKVDKDSETIDLPGETDQNSDEDQTNPTETNDQEPQDSITTDVDNPEEQNNIEQDSQENPGQNSTGVTNDPETQDPETQEVVNGSEGTSTTVNTVKPKDTTLVQATKEYKKIIAVLQKLGITGSELEKFVKDDKPTKKLKELRKLLFKESLEEHVNEEHPAIESDQELEGTDNAVVDCKLYDIITHSEDEKPLDEEYVAPGSRSFENLGETMYVALRVLYSNIKTEADAVDILHEARRFGYDSDELEVLEDLISFVFEYFYNNTESAAEFKRNIIKDWQVSQVNNVDIKIKSELDELISKFSKTRTKKQELLFQAINTLVLELL